MTTDDVLYIADKHDIQIKASGEDMITATKDDEEITFDVTMCNRVIYTFDI